MAQPENAVCADCIEFDETPWALATEPHHVVKVKDDPARMYDVTNLRPLCHRHHSIRTRAGE